MAQNNGALQLLRGQAGDDNLPKLKPGQPYYYKPRNFLYVGQDPVKETGEYVAPDPLDANRLRSATSLDGWIQLAIVATDDTDNPLAYRLKPSADSFESDKLEEKAKPPLDLMLFQDVRAREFQACRLQAIQIGTSSTPTYRLYATNIGWDAENQTAYPVERLCAKYIGSGDTPVTTLYAKNVGTYDYPVTFLFASQIGSYVKPVPNLYAKNVGSSDTPVSFLSVKEIGSSSKKVEHLYVDKIGWNDDLNTAYPVDQLYATSIEPGDPSDDTYTANIGTDDKPFDKLFVKNIGSADEHVNVLTADDIRVSSIEALTGTTTIRGSVDFMGSAVAESFAIKIGAQTASIKTSLHVPLIDNASLLKDTSDRLNVGACLTYLLKKNSKTVTSGNNTMTVNREGNIAWISNYYFNNQSDLLQIPEEYRPFEDTDVIVKWGPLADKFIAGQISKYGRLILPTGEDTNDYVWAVYGCWEIEPSVL